MSDVVLLLFNLNQHVQGGVELGHFGIGFTQDRNRFSVKFLKDCEVSDGEIGGCFFRVGGEAVFHNGYSINHK